MPDLYWWQWLVIGIFTGWSLCVIMFAGVKE